MSPVPWRPSGGPEPEVVALRAALVEAVRVVAVAQGIVMQLHLLGPSEAMRTLEVVAERDGTAVLHVARAVLETRA